MPNSFDSEGRGPSNVRLVMAGVASYSSRVPLPRS